MKKNPYHWYSITEIPSTAFGGVRYQLSFTGGLEYQKAKAEGRVISSGWLHEKGLAKVKKLNEYSKRQESM
tara:strand:- start:1661 stop:1873 length:213 start_codon:yes stop_codon:yes gene_type:complete